MLMLQQVYVEDTDTSKKKEERTQLKTNKKKTLRIP